MLKTPQDRYLDSLVVDMREAVGMFRKFDRAWNELNEALNDLLDREGTLDIVQRDKVKRENLTLAGHMAAAQWWRDKAHMLSSVIQVELAVRR